jgi:hypothetical protein
MFLPSLTNQRYFDKKELSKSKSDGYTKRLLHDIFHIGPGISPRFPYQTQQRSWRADMGRGLITGTIWKISCHNLFITYFTLTYCLFSAAAFCLGVDSRLSFSLVGISRRGSSVKTDWYCLFSAAAFCLGVDSRLSFSFRVGILLLLLLLLLMYE